MDTKQDNDTLVDSHVAAKAFVFAGRKFLPGEPVTIAVLRHDRFDALVHTGYVKEVR